MIGIGGSGLAADGTCVPPLQPPAGLPRDDSFGDSRRSAAWRGLSLTIGGAVLVGLPPRPEAAQAVHRSPLRSDAEKAALLGIDFGPARRLRGKAP